jgi:hypothetical protein
MEGDVSDPVEVEWDDSMEGVEGTCTGTEPVKGVGSAGLDCFPGGTLFEEYLATVSARSGKDPSMEAT